MSDGVTALSNAPNVVNPVVLMDRAGWHSSDRCCHRTPVARVNLLTVTFYYAAATAAFH